jgi:hypothetical protein
LDARKSPLKPGITIMEQSPQTERECESLLLDLFDAVTNGDNPDEDVTEQMQLAKVVTFDDVGMMTRNKGLVLRFDDGREYQLTIVRSG